MLEERKDAGTGEAEKEPYIGSVRFFKNMILLCVVILIIIPTVSTFHYKGKVDAAENELLKLNVEMNEIKTTAEEKIAEARLGMVPLNSEPEPIEYDEPSYQSLFPDFYAPQEYGATERRENMAFLTFDDGPTLRTEEILDILSQRDVKATFFVVHHDDEGTADIMRRIVDEGHTIAMHSYLHDYSSIYGSVEDYLGDMYKIFSEIRETTGYTPTLFRFPGGSINVYNASIYQEMISEMIRRGFVPFDWNVSSEDAVTPPLPAYKLVNNVMSNAGNVERAVVLLHDSFDKVSTVEALPLIIAELDKEGFDFDRLTHKDVPVIYRYKN